MTRRGLLGTLAAAGAAMLAACTGRGGDDRLGSEGMPDDVAELTR